MICRGILYLKHIIMHQGHPNKLKFFKVHEEELWEALTAIL